MLTENARLPAGHFVFPCRLRFRFWQSRFRTVAFLILLSTSAGAWIVATNFCRRHTWPAALHCVSKKYAGALLELVYLASNMLRHWDVDLWYAVQQSYSL